MPSTTRLTTKTKDPLNALLLQPGIAIEWLIRQEVFMPIVASVTLPDPTANRLLVAYHSYGQTEDHTVELTLEDFLRPFMALRLKKAQEYECEPQGADAMRVFSRFSPDASYLVERVPLSEDYRLHCDCPHAESQRTVFPAVPVLWQLLGEQAHCKHIVKAAFQWSIDLPGFRLIAD